MSKDVVLWFAWLERSPYLIADEAYYFGCFLRILVFDASVFDNLVEHFFVDVCDQVSRRITPPSLVLMVCRLFPFMVPKPRKKVLSLVLRDRSFLRSGIPG